MPDCGIKLDVSRKKTSSNRTISANPAKLYAVSGFRAVEKLLDMILEAVTVSGIRRITRGRSLKKINKLRSRLLHVVNQSTYSAQQEIVEEKPEEEGGQGNKAEDKEQEEGQQETD